MNMTGKTILDSHGRVMFHCADCGNPMTEDDFFALSLRVPDWGETRDEYCDAELVDTVRHAECGRIASAG